MVKGDQFEVEKIVKNSGSSFYWGMKILPNKQARAMFAVYAFCRIVDDIADEIKSKIKREKLLKEWELTIKNLFLKQITKNSVERELLFSIKEFNLAKPAGDGILSGINMLDAGFHVGVNTVGQSLRNANRQLRSEPPNPQVNVSPWLMSTIGPDLMRRPLDGGEGCAADGADGNIFKPGAGEPQQGVTAGG